MNWPGLSQLEKVDMILHDILEQMTDEDNIILSDNCLKTSQLLFLIESVLESSEH